MKFEYIPEGVCARALSFDLEDGKVRNVNFTGGCSGNTQGVALLAEGLDANELVDKLSGVRCGMKSTSCPDQLAYAVSRALDMDTDE